MPGIHSKHRLSITHLNEEELVFFLKPCHTTSISTQKVRTRYKVQAKHLKRRLAEKASRALGHALPVVGVLDQSRPISKTKVETRCIVNPEDIKLIFQCDEGVPRGFEGCTKISDIVGQGLWNSENISTQSKVIYFTIGNN